VAALAGRDDPQEPRHLTDGQLAGLTRADAEALVNELQALERRLAHARGELRRLAEEA
jgi:hypothetical protein